MIIKNRDEITSHGDRQGRVIALDILEAGLEAADPYVNTRKLIRIEDDRLMIGGHPEMDVSGYGDEVVDLAGVENIYVIGAGKAVQRQARALEDLLGNRLTEGAITIKRGEPWDLSLIKVTEGAHPVPDEHSVEGTRKIVEIAKSVGKNDLVFTIFSDGASSLSPLPAPGITLDDLRTLYRLAIKHGSQRIIISLLGYFSQISRGRLMRMIQPARSINLVMQVGLFQRWRGVLPKTSSFVPSWPPGTRRMEEDVRMFKTQAWFDELPFSMKSVFDRLDLNYEVPDLEEYKKMRFSFWQPIDLYQMVEGARVKAQELGLKGVVLSAHLTAISSNAASILAQIGRECEVYNRPFEPPVALITGGHLDVPVGDATGVGGRNQEFALVWGKILSTQQRTDKSVVVAAMDSDGTDGPGTQLIGGDYICMAGGVVDGYTSEEAAKLGLDIDSELANHNSTIALMKLKSAIYTGNTGTCLGDLRVTVIR